MLMWLPTVASEAHTLLAAPCAGYYFSGDGARRDEDGYYWITGRVDDVINVSGHRYYMGSAAYCGTGMSWQISQ